MAILHFVDDSGEQKNTYVREQWMMAQYGDAWGGVRGGGDLRNCEGVEWP